MSLSEFTVSVCADVYKETVFRDCVISSETRNGDTGHVCLYYLSQFFILFWKCISIEVQAPSLHYKSKDYLCLAYALCCFKLQQMHGLTCSVTYSITLKINSLLMMSIFQYFKLHLVFHHYKKDFHTSTMNL